MKKLKQILISTLAFVLTVPIVMLTACGTKKEKQNEASGVSYSAIVNCSNELYKSFKGKAISTEVVSFAHEDKVIPYQTTTKTFIAKDVSNSKVEPLFKPKEEINLGEGVAPTQSIVENTASMFLDSTIWGLYTIMVATSEIDATTKTVVLKDGTQKVYYKICITPTAHGIGIEFLVWTVENPQANDYTYVMLYYVLGDANNLVIAHSFLSSSAFSPNGDEATVYRYVDCNTQKVYTLNEANEHYTENMNNLKSNKTSFINQVSNASIELQVDFPTEE